MGNRGWLAVGGLVALALVAATWHGGTEGKPALSPPNAPMAPGSGGRTPILAEPSAGNDEPAEDGTPTAQRLDAPSIAESFDSTLVVRVKDTVLREPVADLHVGVFPVRKGEEQFPTLFVERSFGNSFEVLKTDGLGQALIEVPSGRRLKVAVWQAGTSLPLLESVCKPIPRGAERKLELSWTPAGRADFYGRCVGDDGRPNGHGMVQVRADGRELAFAKIDWRGRFRVSFEPARRPYLFIRPNGRTPLILPLTTNHGGPENEALIQTEPLAQIDVKPSEEEADPILDRRTEISIAIDLRDIAPKELHAELESREVVLTRATFPIHVPSGADLEITITHPTLGSLLHKEPALAPNEERTLGLSFDKPGPVTGIVLDQNDAPVARVEVQLIQRERSEFPFTDPPVRIDTSEVLGLAVYGTSTDPVFTGPDGRFHFAHVPFGAYVVGVGAKRFDRILPAPVGSPSDAVLARPIGKPVALNLRHGKKPRDLRLRVARDLALRGQVVGLDGEPRSGYLVQSRATDGSWLARSRTDVLGNFVVGPLTAGEQELTAWSIDGNPQSQGARESASRVLSSRTTEELRIVVEPTDETPTLTTSLFGTVSDRDGRRLANARVRAVLPHPGKVPYPGNQLTETLTNERGQYALELPGTVALLLVAEHAGRIGFERIFISPDREATREWHLTVTPQATVALQLPVAPEDDPWRIAVHHRDDPGSGPISTRKTAGGEVDLTLPAGIFELAARNRDSTQVFSATLHLAPLDWRRIIFR